MTDNSINPSAAPRKKRSRINLSSTAGHHTSRKKAVSTSVPQLSRLTDKQAHDKLVKMRWGSWDAISCPFCFSISDHYYRKPEMRWKCKGCGKAFSATSGTVFSSLKLDYQTLLASVLTWINSAEGQPALELMKHTDIAFNTAYVTQQKMREAIVRGYNVGLMGGDIEMDGSHRTGWNSMGGRGVTQLGKNTFEEIEKEKARLEGRELPQAEEPPPIDSSAITTKGRELKKKERKAKEKAEGRLVDGSGRKYHPDRRILLVFRRRANQRKGGSSKTRVLVANEEASAVVTKVAFEYMAVPESYLNSDGDYAYNEVGRQFKGHAVVDHGRMLIGLLGENNNQAESFNRGIKRTEKGIHLNIEAKYMLDYSAETAFKADHSTKTSNGERLNIAMNLALNIGESLFWKGFTHGKHRDFELTFPEPKPYSASGPKKGSNQASAANGRPPR